ncbi:hypothetical protein F5X98DRAFT_385566 [Xylaria grammica]|nr:hypothetical protein F5X98DRAFT_385566 [Xylaria grammica]
MAGKFSDMIVRWLGNIANGSLCRVDYTKELTMEIAGKISSSLAKRVKPSEPRDDRLEPDLSFKHENCRVADMVIEVAWSQSKLQLPDRARRYIEGTEGAIRTVIGLNMNDIYGGGRQATFSFWRGERDGDQWKRTTVVDNMEFIDSNGQAVDECMLSLSLRDFICSEEATEFGDFEDVALKITSKTLYEFYVQAFKAQIADEATEKIEEVQKKANCASERILAIDNFIRERGTRGVSNRILMERKQLADIRAKMAGLKDESAKIASLIGNIEAMMDMVGDRVGVMRKVEKDRVAAARKVAEVETELARLTAEEGNWVERSVIRSRVLVTVWFWIYFRGGTSGTLRLSPHIRIKNQVMKTPYSFTVENILLLIPSSSGLRLTSMRDVMFPQVSDPTVRACCPYIGSCNSRIWSRRLLGPRRPRRSALTSRHPHPHLLLMSPPLRWVDIRALWRSQRRDSRTTTIDLHAGTAASRHQSFLWLHPIHA